MIFSAIFIEEVLKSMCTDKLTYLYVLSQLWKLMYIRANRTLLYKRKVHGVRIIWAC